MSQSETNTSNLENKCFSKTETLTSTKGQKMKIKITN